MKRVQKFSLLLACAILSVMTFLSCGLGDKTDPDHPLFVSYEISVGCEEFNGTDQLLTDINKWISDNSIYYDIEINYTTGAKEEFAQSDAEAVKKYDDFLTKFKSYLNELNGKLSKGAYSGVSRIDIDFFVYAKRLQGQGKDLKSEHVKFIYPSN